MLGLMRIEHISMFTNLDTLDFPFLSYEELTLTVGPNLPLGNLSFSLTAL